MNGTQTPAYKFIKNLLGGTVDQWIAELAPAVAVAVAVAVVAVAAAVVVAVVATTTVAVFRGGCLGRRGRAGGACRSQSYRSRRFDRPSIRGASSAAPRSSCPSPS